MNAHLRLTAFAVCMFVVYTLAATCQSENQTAPANPNAALAQNQTAPANPNAAPDQNQTPANPNPAPAETQTAPQNPTPAPPEPQTAPATPHRAPAPWDNGTAGVGVKISTLGLGIEAAARVTHRLNVRAGVNVLGFSRTFHNDGTNYDGHLDFRTFEAHVDFFPWARSFHISPGVLVYSGGPIKATAFVPPGQSFKLGGVAYYSDPAVPTTGTASVDFNQAAPMITLGWGNLVPRTLKHLTFHTELGVAFQGSPQATLNLAGDVCPSNLASGVGCGPAATLPGLQANVVAQQHKINNDISFFQAYPIISFGFGYKF
jgi:hypothetical protein